MKKKVRNPPRPGFEFQRRQDLSLQSLDVFLQPLWVVRYMIVCEK